MTGSSTWMVPLLLLALFVSLLQSVSTRCRGMHEFGIDVDALESNLSHCPENCSSVPIDSMCKCLHLNVSETCNFPKYFIDGLNSLPESTSSQTQIQKLLMRLKAMKTMKICVNISCSLTLTYDPVISPKNFSKKLVLLKEQINNRMNSLP